jgi:hypothetical protein
LISDLEAGFIDESNFSNSLTCPHMTYVASCMYAIPPNIYFKTGQVKSEDQARVSQKMFTI